MEWKVKLSRRIEEFLQEEVRRHPSYHRTARGMSRGDYRKSRECYEFKCTVLLLVSAGVDEATERLVRRLINQYDYMIRELYCRKTEAMTDKDIARLEPTVIIRLSDTNNGVPSDDKNLSLYVINNEIEIIQ